MGTKTLPIEYRAVVADRGGKETHIDLESPGWLQRPEIASALMFTLHRKEDADEALPIVSVHLAPLPDGKPKRLVYLSRVFGRVDTNAEEKVSAENVPLFRLYCVGWEAEIAGRTLRVVAWIYPGGSIVWADEPPWVDDLIEDYASARKLAAAALSAAAN